MCISVSPKSANSGSRRKPGLSKAVQTRGREGEAMHSPPVGEGPSIALETKAARVNSPERKLWVKQ